MTQIQTGEELGFFILEKNQRLHLNYDVESYSTKREKKWLTASERSYYLRDTILSPIRNEIKKLAESLTNSIRDKKEKARELFYYIVDNYKYVYPPSSRGALSFLECRKGDCGEFSFLYTALCRSIGIPARTIMGSWSYGKMNGHAWNEIFIEDEGWIPVDTRMGNIQKNKWSKFFGSYVKTLPWTRYFGETEGQRVVFSKDTEIELIPPYSNNENELISLEPLYINNKPFYWGFQSLNGKAPYLQPIYIEFENIDEFKLPHNVSDFFGFWQVKEKGLYRNLLYLRNISFAIGVGLLCISFFLDSLYIELIYKLSFIVSILASIIRKVKVIIFTIFLLIMVLSVVITISQLRSTIIKIEFLTIYHLRFR